MALINEGFGPGNHGASSAFGAAYNRKLNSALDPFRKTENNRYRRSKPFDLKYPHTIGDAPSAFQVDYNTNLSSEFATTRASEGIDKESIEPFVFFEFMEIIPKLKKEKNKRQRQFQQSLQPKKEFPDGPATSAANVNASMRAIKDTVDVWLVGDSADKEEDASQGLVSGAAIEKATSLAEESGLLKPALRQYKGSVALYMPTDIQINDGMTYNDNTRKTFGIVQGIVEDDVRLDSATGAALGLATVGLGTGLGALSKLTPFGGSQASALGGLIGAAGVGVVTDEYQRSTGKASNPHDYMAYQSTQLRTFTYTYTFLPDSREESQEVTEIIKQFRHAAHAERIDAVALTVPEHVIVSHHGAGDMIQLPPLVIESVNITYNPNNSSFFVEDGHPVEVGMSVTLKEIVPIYKQDVEGGM